MKEVFNEIENELKKALNKKNTTTLKEENLKIS